MPVEEEHTSGISDAPASKLRKNLLSRFWHIGAAVVYFILTIVALVCVITFALFNRSFTKDAWPFNTIELGPLLGKCILYAGISEEIDGMEYIALSSGTLGASCAFNTWGEVVVLLIGVMLLVWSLVKAAIGVKALNIFLFMEFAVIVLMGILTLVISSLFSAGLNTTCGTYRKFFQNLFPDEPIPNDCSQYFFPNDEAGDGSVLFYPKVHTAEVTAWITVCILAVLGAVDLVLMCLFVVARRRRNQEVSYDTLQFDGHAGKEESMKSVHGGSD